MTEPASVVTNRAGSAPPSARFGVVNHWSAASCEPNTSAARMTKRARRAKQSDAASESWLPLACVRSSTPTDAISVSTLADSSTVWPTLLRIAKDGDRERELRKSAVFWLGQAASDAAAALNGLAEDENGDVEVRKQAVFALSQRPNGEGVAPLLAIARGKLDPRIRRQAIFWLGQSGDARAVSYFEEVLAKP